MADPGLDAPDFNAPRVYQFQRGMTIPISTFGGGEKSQFYCTLIFSSDGYCFVQTGNQMILVPPDNVDTLVGSELTVKFAPPRVKLIPRRSTGGFRAGVSLPISPVEQAACRTALEPAAADTEKVQAPILANNPTLVAAAPEVLRTFYEHGEAWRAPEGFADEVLVLEGDRVLFQARVEERGRATILNREAQGREPVVFNRGGGEYTQIRDRGAPGEPVKALIGMNKGRLEIVSLADTALQIGSRDEVFRERLTTLDGVEGPLAVSGTSTIYPKGMGFSTLIRPTDGERVFRVIPMGNWELGASVILMVREGIVTLQNRSTSNPSIKTVRVMPNRSPVVIDGHVHAQLFDDQGALTLALVALSDESFTRISDSAGNESLHSRTHLNDLSQRVARVQRSARPPEVAVRAGPRDAETVGLEMPPQEVLEGRGGCLLLIGYIKALLEKAGVKF
jgi:hypothetical protein